MGSVSFLNAKPLIYGLESAKEIAVLLDVPSRLLGGLAESMYDVALLPVIDYHRLPSLRIVPSGGIGCDGPTLTVRVFSRVPIEQIQTLACDADSHTSVALVRIVLAEQYGILPAFLDLATGEQADARLLIGDKVIQQDSSAWAHELDLGEAWKKLTGLPFVFAVWMARKGTALADLPRRLQHARQEGTAHINEIVAKHATALGWPAEIAREYLTSYLRFEIGLSQIEAMRVFGELAARYEIVRGPVRELEFY